MKTFLQKSNGGSSCNVSVKTENCKNSLKKALKQAIADIEKFLYKLMVQGIKMSVYKMSYLEDNNKKSIVARLNVIYKEICILQKGISQAQLRVKRHQL